MFSYDDIDCEICARRWSLTADISKFVPCDKHLKVLDGTEWNADYIGTNEQGSK